jgi:uncharacterized coiled-coil protein SlyX
MDNREVRLREAEIKLAFLERDLDEYKEVVQELHLRLARMEKAVRDLEAAREAAQRPDQDPAG